MQTEVDSVREGGYEFTMIGCSLNKGDEGSEVLYGDIEGLDIGVIVTCCEADDADEFDGRGG